jgi:hypothetical protein
LRLFSETLALDAEASWMVTPLRSVAWEDAVSVSTFSPLNSVALPQTSERSKVKWPLAVMMPMGRDAAQELAISKEQRKIIRGRTAPSIKLV